MRGKKLLAMLLALCLVVTVISPAAVAVNAGENVVVNGVVEEATAATPEQEVAITNGLLASGQTVTTNTLRGETVEEEGEGYTPFVENGSWSVEAGSAPTVSLLNKEDNACLEELKELADLYSKNEVVSAFVVMEDAPLAEIYTSRSMVNASLETKLIEKQDVVINAIEKSVLGGEELEVRYQFTYLTNSFSIKTEFGNLEAIAKIPGVKSVFVTPMYETASTTAVPNTAASGAMTGVADVWQDLGYTGTGMKIAIIDTGLDLDHPSFAADPETNENSLDKDDITAVLKDLNAYSIRPTISANTLYRSVKVPYAFNYVDGNLIADHSSDYQGDHGTHVAGIAAANALDSTSVVGMAPDAQIIVMKVFGAAHSGAAMDDIVAALEDAMTLGCDVVNASLGSSAGFSQSGSDEMDAIYARIAEQDIVACFSAGNEGTSSYGNMWGTDANRTSNPDNATVGSPSTYVNVMSIASAENSEVMTPYFAMADGTEIFYQPGIDYLYGYAYGIVDYYGGETLEYAFVDGLGYEEDFYDEEGNSLVEGKIAIIMRGEISFGEKVQNAAYAGALAAIIWNNNDEDDIFSFGMNTVLDDGSYPWIPSVLISLSDGLKLAAAEEKTLEIAVDQAPRMCEGGQMSSFSSWGVSPDLGISPDITGIGGNVYSCYDGGTYGLMSGTSMSSPQLAGISALVMQHLYEVYPDAEVGTIRELAEYILMSTAEPIINTSAEWYVQYGYPVEASPRQQGAGLVNALDAVTTTTYLTVDGGRPKAEMGDNEDGKYTFSFEIHNFGEEAKTYTMDASLLTESYVDYGVAAFMTGEDMPLGGAVIFDQDEVVVPAGETVTVNVTVSLSKAAKAELDYHYENGAYVEGFVYLYNEEGASELSLPFLGFYGDWTDAPVFDTAYWYDNSFWGLQSITGLPEGDEYYHVLWTDLAGSGWVLGFNPYSGATLNEEGNVAYDPSLNVISPNGDGVLDGLSDIYISLLRNARTLTFTYTVDGEIVHRETVEYARKTMYYSSYGQVVPWLYSWYGSDPYDFQGLESGTEVILTVDATVDYGNGGENSISFPIYIDTEAPVLCDVYDMPVDGSHYLAVEASDETALAAVYLMNPSGTTIYGAAYDYQMSVNEDGEYVCYFDINGLGTEFMVIVCDYAANESYHQVSYKSAEDGNLPEMDTSVLYAYRVFDEYIYSDHMYGWVQMNKPAEGENANIGVWTDDYMEYAAINAAEYVDGKIFAVDAVYNLVYLEPGLFNRHTITNIGVNVLDMTFDDSTDTMYVLAKDGYYTALYSMDLLTGELTLIKDYGYYYYGPYAIADDDNGTLYAIKYNGANIYTLDVENDYAMVQVTDADGNAIVITDTYGNNCKPNYAQSMTWEDGVLYWAYYTNSWSGFSAALISINTTDWTFTAAPYAALAYDADYNLVEYYPTSEMVGLFTMTDTEYEIPASESVTSIGLDVEEIILSVGESNTLSVSYLPWNFEMDASELVWSSSDETVVSVADGVVTGVGGGTAVVTVSYGDLSASCSVMVVDVSGDFYAYNFYTGDGYYGYMINVDLSTMDYYLVSEYSPVDFMAGDYNGHDGYFYGYDIGGQLYRYDFATNSVTALGSSLGTYPVDMAYDYSTGMMYAMTLDYMTYENVLYAVNMKNGSVKELAVGSGLMTLACSTDGILYAMDADSNLCELTFVDYSAWGMGIIIQTTCVLEGVYGELYLLESMCWDHNNDVLLWNWCEGASIVMLDVGERIVEEDDWGSYTYYEGGYSVNLGDPSESGVLELTGMFVLPEEIPALPEVAVESVSAEDMGIFAGYEKVPAVSVDPFNATCQDLTLTSSDTSVVEITESGALYGVSAGTAVVTAVLNDSVSGTSYEVSFNVTVEVCADNMFAHLLTDLSTYSAQAWVQLQAGNPSVYDFLGLFDYTIFTADYVDGKIYTYGYDAYDWTGNQQFFVLDAGTYAIEKQVDMGESFPFVYDMTYDYVTSTMFVLAGAGEDDTQLYVADMETGEITLVMDPEPQLMAIAAVGNGDLYAIASSETEIGYDDWGWETYSYGNAKLYKVDPANAAIELVGDTGIQSNMISSMAYDYDTDSLYWHAFFRESYWHPSYTHLAIVDTETGAATSLGSVGAAGCQIGGIFFICDEYPEADTETFRGAIMSSSKETLHVGDTKELDMILFPTGLDVTVEWSSNRENVASVDENGVVTAIAQGKAVITATVTCGDVVKTASCTVAVLNADSNFLTYNLTDGGWAYVNRGDYTVVTNITEGMDETPVIDVVSAGEALYGYDVNSQLFQLDPVTFERTEIGEVNSEELIRAYMTYVGYGEEQLEAMIEYYSFEVRDMAYDALNDRVLVLGAVEMYDPDFDEYGELGYGCSIYSVNLETGALEQVYLMEEDYYVKAIAADNAGNVYFYNTFNDDVTKYNTETGVTSKIVSLQTQSIYGDSYCDYSMHYDVLTDTIYMVHTGNGTTYRMVTVDPVTGTLTDCGYIGEAYYDYGSWSYVADAFSGLTFVYDGHVWDEGKLVTPAGCETEGEMFYTCTDVDCDATKTVAIPATGHAYGEWIDCEDGTHKRICANDETHVEGAEHAYGDWTACEDGEHHTHVCDCGKSETEEHKWDDGVVTTEPTYSAKGERTYTCVDCGATKTEEIAVKPVPVVPSTPSEPEETEGEVVENEDGSTTTTVTDEETGTVTETTTTVEGVTGTVVADSEGNVTEVTVEIPADVDTTEPVTVPVEVSTEDETEITVTTNSEEDVVIEIAVADASAGTVIVVVDEEGNETVLVDSLLTENGVAAAVADGATIKVVDNSKDFTDVVEDSWHEDAIDFVSARNIMTGTGDATFAPGSTTSRAMVLTMMARLDGVDTNTGDTWYEVGHAWAVENGISDGTQVTDYVTREQLITMLWRYAQLKGCDVSEGEDTNILSYEDATSVSDWAMPAMQWACSVGLVNGYEDGTLKAQNTASRAEVAQLFKNFMELGL